MKKYLGVFFLIVVSFLYIPKAGFATGVFQVMNLPTQLNTFVGSDFSTRIDFVYSGQYSDSLGVSIKGLSLESGIKLGSINYGINGGTNVWLIGVPTSTFIGDNALTLVLTDNNGALLTQPFNLKIKNPTFVFTDNSTLPDVVVDTGRIVPRVIKYTYDGNDKTTVCLYSPALSENLQIEVGGTNDVCVPGTNGQVTLDLFPRKVGQYTIKASANFAGGLEARKVFILNVVPVVTTISQPAIPVSNITVPSPTPATTVLPVSVPTVISKPLLTPNPTKKKPQPPTESEIKTPSPSSEITASTTIPQQITTPPVEAPEITNPTPPTPVAKQESLFRRIWKKFISWF